MKRALHLRRNYERCISPKRRAAGFLASFVNTTVLWVALLAITIPAVSAPDDNVTQPPVSVEEFQRRLVGPILTFPTPFTAQDEIDFDGVRKMLQRGLEYEEVQVVTLTAGNNQYRVLSYQEVKALTRVVVESAGTRAMSIASTGFWETEQVLDYARFAEEIGASAIQILKPADATDEEVVAFFKKVADSTPLPIVLHGVFSPALLQELVKIESIAAMKEDSGLEYLIARQIEFGDRLVIFPGGFDSRVLVGYPYGIRAYYTVFYQFAPQLGRQFWNSLQGGHLRDAGAFVKKYDYPFAQTWSYPFWVASCANFDVCEPYVRPREKSLGGEEMKKMQAFWNSLGVKADIPEKK
jgi:dihydrodipicolinate synthase/N-acetylneuraminate lyase